MLPCKLAVTGCDCICIWFVFVFVFLPLSAVSLSALTINRYLPVKGNIIIIREASPKLYLGVFGQLCSLGLGEGMVWGTYLEKNCPISNGHLLIFGGSKPLPGRFGGTYAVKIEVQLGICLC